MRPSLADQTFHVGPWRIEPPLNRITGPSGELTVEPRLMQVLVVLAEHAGEVVTKDVLVERVWQGVVVNDSALARVVSELRKVLGDRPQQPTYIETIRKRGYRLVAPVTLHASSGPILSTSGDSIRHYSVPPPEPSPAHASSEAAQPSWVRAAAGLLLVIACVAIVWRIVRPQPLPMIPPPVPLTSALGHERFPALSPDGQRFAYVDIGDPDTSPLFVQAIGATQALQLTDSLHAAAPVFSAHGNSIIFVERSPTTCAISSMDILSQVRTTLGTCEAKTIADLDASPDGPWLIYSDHPNRDAPNNLYLLNTETREQTLLLTHNDAFWGDLYPRFSPDGTRVAFARYVDAEGMDVHIVSLAEPRAVRRLTTEHHRIQGLAWAADGQSIVYAAARRGRFELWRVDLATGVITWVPTAGSAAERPSIARASARLVYESHMHTQHVWYTDVDRPAALWSGSSTQADIDLAVSPDGAYVAFTSNRSGQRELWIATADGMNMRQLTDFPEALVAAPSFSPDGSHLAFEVRGAGGSDIYMLDWATGVPVRLTTDATDDLAPRWSADGQWIYFGSLRSGSWEIWKRAFGSDYVERVTAHGGVVAQESPDGTTLYYVKRDTLGLWAQPLPNGPETVVLPNVQPADWGNWHILADGDVLFVDRVLWQIDGDITRFSPETGISTSIFSPPQPIPYYLAAFAADASGEHLYLSLPDEGGTDVMMIAPFR